jgi:hypothetical protein
MRELEEVIRDACSVFSSLRIPYVIVGGVAVNLLGRARSTFDVDAIADIDAAGAERLVKAFRRKGFEVSREDIEDALKDKGHFSVFDSRSGYRIDCKGAYTTNEKRALSERRRLRVADKFIFVDSAEDLIVMKLLYGSGQDVLDAESVYARQRPSLNMRRISAEARALGVSEEWASLRRRVDRLMAGRKR